MATLCDEHARNGAAAVDMRIQVVSDLHLEFLRKNFPGEATIASAPDADVLVIAGDIASGTEVVSVFKDWPVPVVYVAGNHEFYGHRFSDVRAQLRDACAATGIHFLDNGVVVIDRTRFIGATLWTDYSLGAGSPQRSVMREAQRCMSDHSVIRVSRGAFTPNRALAEHRRSRAWIENALEASHDGSTVVVTHHAPHPRSIAPRFVGDPLNAAFASDLTGTIEKADAWIHGHTHNSSDYEVGLCRVVANPRGYPVAVASAKSLEEVIYENPNFDSALVVEV